MLLRVRPILTRFPTNILYTQVNNSPVHYIPSVWHAWAHYANVADSNHHWSVLMFSAKPLISCFRNPRQPEKYCKLVSIGL